MALTFENLIDHNKRSSFALIVLMVLIVGVLAGSFTLAYSGYYDGQYLLESFFFGAGIGALLTIIGSIISYYGGNYLLMGISNGLKVEYHDDRVLFNVVEEMAIAAGVPVPKVYAIPDESPNAMASGRDPQHATIAVTTGLRKKLDRDELQAVIAHEIAHIKNYDTRLMMLVAVFAGIIVLMSDFFLRTFLDSIRFKGGRRAKGVTETSSRFNLLYTVIFIIVAILLAWLAPIIAKLLQLAVSRQREYLADASAVQFCRNPLALISALKKISTDEETLIYENRATEHLYIVNPNPKKRLQKPNHDSIWSTHPPLIKRIARLRELAGKFPEEES